MVKLEHKLLSNSRSDEVYNLLILTKFPDLPTREQWRDLVMPRIACMGIFDGDDLIAVSMLYKDITQPFGMGWDVAAKKEYRSKWASKRLFRSTFTIAFQHFKADYIFAKTKSRAAKKSLKKLGFTKLYKSNDDNREVYVLNRQNVLPSLRN